MRALVATRGAGAVFAAAGLRCAPHARRAPTTASEILGAHSLGRKAFVGCAAPFGRWRADDLERLADRVESAGGADLRLTPWRAILAPGLDIDNAKSLVEALARDNLIVDGADPRLAVVACPGAPECSSASVRTHAAAAALIPLFVGGAPGLRLHLSGCEKGCAHPHAAPFTLVGRAGRFDLVFDATAVARPALVGLDLDGARCAVARRMREVAPT